MQAEILSIGDELLIGQVVNTNASVIAEQLGRIGISTRRVITVGDRKADIQQAIHLALSDSDLLLITGGLGPTHDDITKVAVGEMFKLGMEFNEDAYQNCLNIFERRGVKMPESNRSQAEVLAGCTVFQNTKGTAPGMLLKSPTGYDGKYLVIMPGVPSEMQEMMRVSVIPYFAPLSDEFIKHTTLMTSGVGESRLAEFIGNEQEFLTDGSTLAYLPHSTGVRLRVSTRGRTQAEVERENAAIVQIISTRIQKFLYATDEMSIEEYIGRLLSERGLTIATAESCTGGLIAHRLTNVAGSSAYFKQSFVLYNNESKEHTLGVRRETLEKFGAVSEEVAQEMAERCLEKSGSDIAVASTGIAGPGGGSETKPVGMLCVSVVTGEKLHRVSRTHTMTFVKERLRNKELFSQAALDLVRQILMRNPD